MRMTSSLDSDQAALWNGRHGRAWIEAQSLLDGMFEPFEATLVSVVHAGSGQRVLDVGCGTGSTTLAVARRLGAKGFCLGVDLSAPMLDVARLRARREGVGARFLCADAQRHTFDRASFDLIISRFGVMFFDQPAIAFANLRSAARRGAQLRFIAWRSAAENPFMTTAERAAAPLLPRLPPRRPDAPGQFSLADRQRLASILEQSGWAGVDIQSLDVECVLPEQALVGYFTRLGPVGLVLNEADEPTRSHVIATVRSAFDPYVHGAEVRYTAACWLVDAVAP